MPHGRLSALGCFGFSRPVAFVSATAKFFIICFRVSRLLSPRLQLGGKWLDRSLIWGRHRVGRATCQLSGNVGVWDATRGKCADDFHQAYKRVAAVEIRALAVELPRHARDRAAGANTCFRAAMRAVHSHRKQALLRRGGRSTQWPLPVRSDVSSRLGWCRCVATSTAPCFR